MTSLLSFLFFGAALLSLWIRRDPKVWGPLFSASLLCGFLAGNISWLGLLWIAGLLSLWNSYDKKPTLGLFLLLILVSSCLKLHLLPGYRPIFFTPKFGINLEAPVIGLFPLAFLVPLARTSLDWKKAAKGFWVGCLGIALQKLSSTWACLSKSFF